MKNLKIELDDYKKWITTTDWYEADKKDEYVIVRDAPSEHDVMLLIEKFGDLPASYLETLKEFGLSEFTYDGYVTKMLAPKEIIELYEVVQNEMDFATGLREELLEEDNFDFSKFIPVMAGDSLDGCWALLNIGNNPGEILYWDTDQAGYTGDTFSNLAIFIKKSIAAAKTGNPFRLT